MYLNRNDQLNSDNTKIAMDHNNRTVEMFAPKTLMNFDAMEDRPMNLTEEEATEFLNERLEKLLKIIHARIEEKYRDFRTAFRAIDKDFGGQLEFKEFMLTLEEMGIKLKLTDFKLIFDALDYDGRGHIDFTKFCYLNADRYSITDLQKRVSI